MSKHLVLIVGSAALAAAVLGACRMDVDSLSGKSSPTGDPSYQYGSPYDYGSSPTEYICSLWELAEVPVGPGATALAETATPAPAPTPVPSPDPSPSPDPASCESPAGSIISAIPVFDNSGHLIRLEIRVAQLTDGTFPDVSGLIYAQEDEDYDTHTPVNVDFNCDAPSASQDSAYAKIDCVPSADAPGSLWSTEISSSDISVELWPLAVTLRHKSCGATANYKGQRFSLQGEQACYGIYGTPFNAAPSVSLPDFGFSQTSQNGGANP